jgi:hypothetical protein
VKKEEIIAMLDRFSDDINPEELIDQLYLKGKLDRAEQAIGGGSTMRHDDVIKRSQEWFQ